MLTIRRASARVWYEQVYALLLPIIKEACECKAVTQRLLAHYIGYDLTQHVLESELTADEKRLRAINKALERLKQHEPIQYILESAPFLSDMLYVNPHVLIPRPETEEMVNAILQENDLRGARILDICTGSGCIAIALKKNGDTAVVEALDISQEALAVAKKNAAALHVQIDWYQLDFLREELPDKQWDMIVSNPPYIPFAEKASMSSQVVDHEPAIALFVPDEEPLRFYKRLARAAKAHLTREGKVYAEFHEKSGRGVKAIFEAQGFRTVRIYRDLQGKERWLSAYC